MTTIFLHGLGQTPASWDAVRRTFGGQVLCPDLFAPAWSGGVSYQELYRSFAGYCETLDGPLQLCGLSLGGILALQYAAEHPKRMAALALIGTPCVMPKGLLRLQSAVFRLLPGGAFRQMGLTKGQVLALTASMRELDFREDLGRISCPVLVLCGERDRANQKSALELRAGLPKAELARIPGAGHEVNRDTPEALAEALRRFFRQDV